MRFVFGGKGDQSVTRVKLEEMLAGLREYTRWLQRSKNKAERTIPWA